jgi:hypothetical protein
MHTALRAASEQRGTQGCLRYELGQPPGNPQVWLMCWRVLRTGNI